MFSSCVKFWTLLSGRVICVYHAVWPRCLQAVVSPLAVQLCTGKLGLRAEAGWSGTVCALGVEPPLPLLAEAGGFHRGDFRGKEKAAASSAPVSICSPPCLVLFSIIPCNDLVLHLDVDTH